MIARLTGVVVLILATFPFIYYFIALYSSWAFFRRTTADPGVPKFTPPVSNLKPIRGIDPDAYENFASFCRQDYPEYELLFCVSDVEDPVMPILEKLVRDFPERSIRTLIDSGQGAANDKVAKLSRLVREAQNEFVVMGDSDVRVRPDYLRNVLGP